MLPGYDIEIDRPQITYPRRSPAEEAIADARRIASEWIDDRLDALRGDDAVEAEALRRSVALKESIPPGYRLTAEAAQRLRALAACPNRNHRRALFASYRKNPIQTFERVGRADAEPLGSAPITEGL